MPKVSARAFAIAARYGQNVRNEPSLDKLRLSKAEAFDGCNRRMSRTKGRYGHGDGRVTVIYVSGLISQMAACCV